jgi:hypothetical protein
MPEDRGADLARRAPEGRGERQRKGDCIVAMPGVPGRLHLKRRKRPGEGRYLPGRHRTLNRLLEELPKFLGDHA